MSKILFASRATFVVPSQPLSHFKIDKHRHAHLERFFFNYRQLLASYFFSHKFTFYKIISFYFNKHVTLIYHSTRLHLQQQSLPVMIIRAIFNSYKNFNFFFSINNQVAYYQFFFLNKVYLLQKIKNFYSISKTKKTYRINYFNTARTLWKTISPRVLSQKSRTAPTINLLRKLLFVKPFAPINAYSALKNLSLIGFSCLCLKLQKYLRRTNYLYFYYLKNYVLTVMKLKRHYRLIFSRTFLFKPEMFFSKYFIYSSKRFAKPLKRTNSYEIFLTHPTNLYQKIIFYKQRFIANNNFVQSNFFFFNVKFNKMRTDTKKLVRTIGHNALQTDLSLKSNMFFRFINPLHHKTHETNKKLFLNLSYLEFLFTLIFKPIFFKYFLFLNSHNTNKFIILNRYVDGLQHYCKKFFFYSTTQNFLVNNLIPNAKFSYTFKKKIVRVFNSTFFFIDTTVWYYHTIVRFLEFCSGKKACVRIAPFLMNALTFYEKFQCVMWAHRVRYYRKVLGPRLFLSESLQIMYLALKYKDPFLLSNWMTAMMYKISFWKYKTFLRYIKYAMRCFFWVIFKELNVRGIKYQLKGKISVAGNARTRTAFHYVGRTSHGTFNNKILYNLNLVRTFTGVLGLKLWIVF